MALYKKGSNSAHLKTKQFPIGDDHINLRELSSTELLGYKARMGDKELTDLEFVYEMLAKCAVDDSGNPIFESPADVKENLVVGVSAFIAMQNCVLELSGLTDAKKN